MSKTKDILKTDRQKIRDHWEKSDAQLEKEINIIREWVKTQPHLPEMPTDNMIEFFLTNCKFSIEKTKSVLDMYYTIKNIVPDMYINKHPTEKSMKQVFDYANICPLPNLTDNLHRITFIKYKEENADLFDGLTSTVHLLRNIFEVRTKEDLTLGEVVVFDGEHFKLSHVVKLTPPIVKKTAFILEKVWANRLKEIHMVKCPPYIDTIVNLAKTFLSKKLKERLFVHDKLEDLFKVVPQELLPSDYGGKEKSLDDISDLWKLKLEEYGPRFDKLDEMNVDETLRPEKLENSELLGFHGNFKKIDFD